MKDRFHYIDIAKGILILLVVIHHQPQLAAEFGISNPFLAALACSSDYFNAFFMPAFFVITGYCTNFQKLPFGKFLGRQAMTIMLPAFCLGAVSVWISLFGKGCTNPIEYCKIGFRTFAISGGAFWFLPALFLSKVLYGAWLSLLRRLHVADKKTNVWLTAAYVLVMYIIGCILHENAVPDIWYFEHALTLMVFLFVGQLFKTYPVNRYNPIAAVVYVLAIVALQCAGLPHPFITANIHVVLSNSWLYLPLAVTGTLLILWLSERIGKNGLLEYFGKSSLVVYTLHISVLAACQNTAARWWGEAATTGVWFSVAQLVLTLLLLLGLIGLLNLKYLRFLTGRFN